MVSDVEDFIAGVSFDSRGLVPAIAQDSRTRAVLMMAWMSEESLRRTVSTGRATYFSRSRDSLWVKGETSGNTQSVVGVSRDCDGDTLLVTVEQHGPACHTGSATCFGEVDAPPQIVPAVAP